MHKNCHISLSYLMLQTFPRHASHCIRHKFSVVKRWLPPKVQKTTKTQRLWEVWGNLGETLYTVWEANGPRADCLIDPGGRCVSNPVEPKGFGLVSSLCRLSVSSCIHGCQRFIRFFRGLCTRILYCKADAKAAAPCQPALLAATGCEEEASVELHYSIIPILCGLTALY